MKTLKLMLVACVVLLFLGCSWVPDLPWADDEPIAEDDGTDLSEEDNEPIEPTEEAPEENNDEEEAEPTDTPAPTPKPTEVEVPRETDQEGDDEQVSIAADSSGIVESLDWTVGERGARVYAAAGSATPILRTLAAGTEVTMLSISSNGIWVEVDPSDLELAASVQEAWIPMRHLVELTDSERSSLFQFAPELTADVSAWVRLEPSKTSTIMNSMEEGERAKILGMNEDITWYEIEKENGRTGWISASIVTLAEPDNLKGIARFNPKMRDGVTPTPTFTPTPTATPIP